MDSTIPVIIDNPNISNWSSPKRMPIVLLDSIFSFLIPIKETMLICESTCKYWAITSRQGYGWKKLHVCQSNGFQVKKPKILLMFLYNVLTKRRLQRLQHLRITRSCVISTLRLNKMSDIFSNLRHLNMSCSSSSFGPNQVFPDLLHLDRLTLMITSQSTTPSPIILPTNVCKSLKRLRLITGHADNKQICIGLQAPMTELLYLSVGLIRFVQDDPIIDDDDVVWWPQLLMLSQLCAHNNGREPWYAGSTYLSLHNSPKLKTVHLKIVDIYSTLTALERMTMYLDLGLEELSIGEGYDTGSRMNNDHIFDFDLGEIHKSASFTTLESIKLQGHGLIFRNEDSLAILPRLKRMNACGTTVFQKMPVTKMMKMFPNIDYIKRILLIQTKEDIESDTILTDPLQSLIRRRDDNNDDHDDDNDEKPRREKKQCTEPSMRHHLHHESILILIDPDIKLAMINPSIVIRCSGLNSDSPVIERWKSENCQFVCNYCSKMQRYVSDLYCSINCQLNDHHNKYAKPKKVKLIVVDSAKSMHGIGWTGFGGGGGVSSNACLVGVVAGGVALVVLVADLVDLVVVRAVDLAIMVVLLDSLEVGVILTVVLAQFHLEVDLSQLLLMVPVMLVAGVQVEAVVGLVEL